MRQRQDREGVLGSWEISTQRKIFARECGLRTLLLSRSRSDQVYPFSVVDGAVGHQ
jgi:hypothetical protein